MSPRHRIIVLGGLAAGTLFGCASSNPSGSMPSGAAPTISNLTVTPTNVAVGKLQTLSGQFDFEDPDGDLSEIGLTVKMGAQSTSIPRSALQNVSGQTAGQGFFAAALQVPQSGTVELHVVVYDAAGQVSNELQQNLTAQ